MTTVSTCLLFDTEAEEAARFYVGLVPGSSLDRVSRPAPERPALLVEFRLAGTAWSALNWSQPVPRGPGVSVVLRTTNQAECDRIWAGHLAHGGTEQMCGRLTDRWGIAWQIFPEGMDDLLFGGTPQQNERAFACTMGQRKIDMAAIAAARQGV